ELCDLSRKNRRKLIGTLSKGFRQRVGIADAILSKPEVTIMDEPTIGLDPHQVLLIRELIQSLRGTTTVILSSHILSEVEKSCDKVIIINQGLLVASGTPDALRQEFTGARTYRVEVLGDVKVLLQAVRQVQGDLQIHRQQSVGSDGFVQYELTSKDGSNRAEELMRQLAATPELRVRGLQLVEARLEDVFLAATRRSWEVEMSKGNQ
ncbi:MAG: ABC transporter ATP-binding protein, partial [Verrucomicrobia bacterium]|nr:ABC transporter ATP-binding protein [Verrucomicrobiota bacterium]